MDNTAHHARQEFDRTTIYWYISTPNGRVGMTRTTSRPVDLQVWPLQRLMPNWSTPWKQPGFLQERAITIQRGPIIHLKRWANVWSPANKHRPKFIEYRETQWSHDEVYMDGLKMNKIVWEVAVTNHHFQNGDNLFLPVQGTSRQQHHICCWGYIQHSDTGLSQAQTHESSLAWCSILLGRHTDDKDTHANFWWRPSPIHCCIEGNERVDKPLFHYNIQEVRVKCDISVHGKGL